MARSFVCFVILGVLLASCSPGGEMPGGSPASDDGRPNILIIVLDACRADKLGCYGYERDTSPAIDALARDPDTVLFRRHYVQGAWTKTATASLFTGLFAFQHGVLTAEIMEEAPSQQRDLTTYTAVLQVLDERFDTMAERLGLLGFHTFAVTKSHHLVPSLGFAQGFDDYYSRERIKLSDEGRVAKLLELIGSASRPFFSYLHLSGCHHPFPLRRRHPEFMERYGAGVDYDEEVRRAAGIDFRTGNTKYGIRDGRIKLDSEDVRFLNLVYDAQLRYVDENYVAWLIRELKELERYDDTLIVLTADHGEELYEHQGYAHGHALWDEVIHVPLLVKFPRGSRPEVLGREVSAVTQSIDLLPSFLAFTGHEVPAELPGTDIFGGAPRGFAYSQTKDGWSLVKDGYKYIEEEERTFLFNLEEDPVELSDLVVEEPDRVAAMREVSKSLRQYVAIDPAGTPQVETELDAETIEDLRSLGYVR